ncbi:MAG TPA: hypothetical protein VF733_04605 [Candidatus Saccharimonadales bacterium]
MTMPVESPPRVPWSQLGPEFAMIWGRAKPENPQPEHMEVIGMNGSGKTYFIMKILQEAMLVRNTRIVIVVTKQDDDVFAQLGWPIVREFNQIRKHRQCIYWPLTTKLGDERKAFHEVRLYELLTRMWKKKAWFTIAFDEIAYVESLSPRVKSLVAMWWREARSMKITVIAMKQRPQGVQRDMHSETWWTVAFKPKDENDAERFAELLGNRKMWMALFEQMDADNHEFVIKHTRTGIVYISWIDIPLEPIEPPSEKEKIFSFV